MKLSYKIFTAYLLVSLILLISVFAVIKLYGDRHFKKMKEMADNKLLTILTYELADHYRANGSWKGLAAPGGFETFISGIQWPAPDIMGPPPGPPPPRHHPPLTLAVLFDAKKIQVAGPITDTIPETAVPIRVNDDTVGWTGLISGPKPPPPLWHMLDRNLPVIYLIIAILFALAGSLSYLLSRHILSPVNRLIRGTRDLNRFRFNTRITVNTGDELGRLADSFNRMAATLERYEAARKQWMVDISHELRTPLAILKGEIEAVQDGIRKPEPEQMGILHREVCQLESIVNDLRCLSRADADGLALNLAPTAPAAILKQVTEEFKTLFTRARIVPDIRLDHPDVSIPGDEAKLRQVFSNILENNLKFSDRPAKLFIRDHLADTEYRITISDEGPGVLPRDLERIFDRLYKTDPSRQRETGGSGLGLAICRSLIKAHGGNIKAGLSEGSGLTITLSFPVETR